MVSPLHFAAYVAQRLLTDQDPLTLLAHIKVEELYLVCACMQGHTGALAALDEQIEAVVRTVHMRLHAPRG